MSQHSQEYDVRIMRSYWKEMPDDFRKSFWKIRDQGNKKNNEIVQQTGIGIFRTARFSKNREANEFVSCHLCHKYFSEKNLHRRVNNVCCHLSEPNWHPSSSVAAPPLSLIMLQLHLVSYSILPLIYNCTITVVPYEICLNGGFSSS